MLWKTPLERPAGTRLEPVLPPSCRAEGPPEAVAADTAALLRWEVDCGAGGLVGETLGVDGLEQTGTGALLRIELRDGRVLQAVLGPGVTRYAVPERAGALDVARDYAALGLRHILGGPDHLLFVLGLMLLVRGRRALLAAVSAFTLGHSATLSLAVLGFLGLAAGPVELAIAVSLLVLAVELARGDSGSPSLLRRRPWPAAALFGLLHGLGFAGALRDVGLPGEEIPLALAAFNVGIELGQLAFVLGVLLLRATLRPLWARAPEWVGAVPAYAIGTLAAYWCIERAAALL